MPRTSQRKSVSRAVETKQALAELEKQAGSDGLPKPSPDSFAKASPPWLPDSATNLAVWLKNLASAGDDLTYSMLLQIWLHLNGVPLPKGVFKTELKSPGRGRPLADLGFRALLLYRRNTFGWRKVAQRLVPDRYEANPDQAVKYIKDLAASAHDAPDHYSDLEEALKIGSSLLGITKLREEAEEEYRRLEDSL
jgi:hypothetical protein